MSFYSAPFQDDMGVDVLPQIYDGAIDEIITGLYHHNVINSWLSLIALWHIVTGIGTSLVPRLLSSFLLRAVQVTGGTWEQC